MKLFSKLAVLFSLLSIALISPNGMRGQGQNFPGGVGKGGTTYTNGPTVIDPTLAIYGVKMDAQLCTGLGSTIVVTLSSTTLSCSNALITPFDWNKDIFATTGCCLQNQSNAGAVILAQTTIAVGSFGSSIIVNGPGATAGCTGVHCLIAWGTNDDAAWTLADAAWDGIQNRCGTLLVPSGYSMIRVPHFNAPHPSCESNTSIQSELDWAPSMIGTGPGSSVFIIEPNIDFTTCTFGFGGATNIGCYLAISQVQATGFSFTGGGANTSGPASSHCLVNLGGGSDTLNTGYSGAFANTPNVIGVCKHSGVRAVVEACDGFGRICETADDAQASGAENACYYCFWGDSNGVQIQINSGIFKDFGGEVGAVLSGVGAMTVLGGRAELHGTRYFKNAGNVSATGSAALQVSAGTVYMDGGDWDNSNCASGTCNGLLLALSGVVYAHNVTFVGAASGAAINEFSCTTCKLYDNGGNTFTAPIFANTVANTVFGSNSITGTALATSNIGLTSGWATSSVATAVGDSHSGRFTITGAVGSPTPTLTLTFPTAYYVAPASCQLIETGANDIATLTNPISASASTTSVVFTLTGTPTTVTYQFDYKCGP